MLKVVLFLLVIAMPSIGIADVINLGSPDDRVTVSIVNNEKGLSYQVKVDDKLIINDSSLGLIIDDIPVGASKMEFLGETRTEIRNFVELVAGRTKKVNDFYNAALIRFSDSAQTKYKLNIAVRVYDEGVAIRYILPSQEGLSEFTIQNELTRFSFAADYTCFGLN